MQEVVRRGQNRSWFVDERVRFVLCQHCCSCGADLIQDWIKSKESLDDEGLETADGTAAFLTPDAAKKAAPKRWITVPNDPALRSQPCPICQEKFESVWSDEIQDFIWNDAIKVGSRVYHASCHAEVMKDGGGTPVREGTPDSVLGKRKAEV